MLIDQEFKNLIPLLTAEEYDQLEKNIITEGCRDALVLWRGTLIDGHNRYEICSKHGIDYKTVAMEFADKDRAIEWIILNQFGRRNLSAYDRSLLALKLKPIIAEKAKEQQGTRVNIPQISAKSSPIETREELAKIAGVSHDTINKVEKIEATATSEVKEMVKSGDISINTASIIATRPQEEQNEIVVKGEKEILQMAKTIKAEKKEQRLKETVRPESKPVPTGEYNIILADPPWRYDFAETGNREIENHYPTMILEDIKQLTVPSADNSVLFLWATAPKLQEAFEVMEAWGFNYRSCAVWDKEIIGMGYWFRGQHELLLVGVKGKFSPPEPSNRFSSVIRERRGSHSKKPEQVHEMLEKMFLQGKFLEMFARDKRKGWEVWGNEV